MKLRRVMKTRGAARILVVGDDGMFILIRIQAEGFRFFANLVVLSDEKSVYVHFRIHSRVQNDFSFQKNYLTLGESKYLLAERSIFSLI